MDCDKAFDPATRTLKLRFKKVLDNPKVDGIILFKGKLAETNFYSLDELRRDWDKKFSSNKGKELLRDLMMEEYMKKKRMKKLVRNDNDEHEEYEKDFIEVSEESSSKLKFLVLALVVACLGYCYFGGASYKQRLEDSQAEGARQSKDSKRRGNSQIDSKPVQSTPANKDSSPEPSRSPNKPSREAGESAETENLVSREDKGKKKTGKKK